MCYNLYACLFDLIFFTVSRNSFIRKNILENGINLKLSASLAGNLTSEAPYKNSFSRESKMAA